MKRLKRRFFMNRMFRVSDGCVIVPRNIYTKTTVAAAICMCTRTNAVSTIIAEHIHHVRDPSTIIMILFKTVFHVLLVSLQEFKVL